MSRHSSLQGRRILVTGGTTGIGRETVKRLVEHGPQVLTFGRDVDPLETALANAKDANGRLSLIGHTASGGASPRYCLLMEEQRHMLVAAEEGNSVTVFTVCRNGLPSLCCNVAVPAPAFIFTTTT